jgi:hypothetical protein
MSSLVPCSRCGRHVRAREIACAFCAAALAIACKDEPKPSAQTTPDAAPMTMLEIPADASLALAPDAGADANLGEQIADLRSQAAVYGAPALVGSDGGAAPTGDPVKVGALNMTVPVPNAAAVLARNSARFRACYNRGLQMDPTQAGRVTLLIHVAPDGQVESVSVASNTGLSSAVASCCAGAARNIAFDAPGAQGSTISVPLEFSVKKK